MKIIPNPERQGSRAMARRLTEACRRPTAASTATLWKRAWILVTEEP